MRTFTTDRSKGQDTWAPLAWAVLLVALMPVVVEAGPARQVDLGDRIGMSNDVLAMAFDKTSGALLSLRNIEINDEYLKHGADGGNPFRAYVDTTQIPPTLKLGFPWPVQPPEDALGGTLVEPAACRLVEHTFEHVQGTTVQGTGTLQLLLEHQPTGLQFELTVRLRDDDVAVAFDLTVTNQGDRTRRVMMATTHLTGLGLGPDPDKNLGVHLLAFGQSRGAAWEITGDVYGRGWGGQWDAVYDPASGAALGVIVKDDLLRNKIVRRFPGGGMSVFYFDNHELPPGGSISYPTAEVLVHQGDWKRTARRYGEWFRSTFKVRSQPRWLDDVDMFVGPWIPHPDQVAQAKGHPQAPGQFASFSQLPRLFLGGRYDLQEFAQYWQGVIRHQRYDAYQHTDGVYDLRADLGGATAFQEGVLQTERIGRYVGLYVASQTMRNDSIFFQSPYPGADSRPEDWALMETPDAELPEPTAEGHRSFYMCLRHGPWQDHLAGTIQNLMRQTGARYVRIDEFGSNYLVCHNPAHHHGSPWNATSEIVEFLRKIRAAMDEVDPDSLLFTESATDITSLHCDGTLAMWSSGTEIAPLRLVVPEFIGFAYGLGQVECALQGFVTANMNACNSAGWWNPHHSKLWGPGLEHRPACYPQEGEGLGPPMRWHELGHSFAAAVRHGDPLDSNPTGLGQDPNEWGARIWRSDSYWLVVCGSRAATRPDHPVRVQLPPLPPQITSAYEIDTESLVVRDAPLRITGKGAEVTMTGGFSAILLPLPHCPPLICCDELPRLIPGSQVEANLTVMAPWRKQSAPVSATIAVPGLTVDKARVALPAKISVSASTQVDSGYYQLLVTGDCLPLKRWIHCAELP